MIIGQIDSIVYLVSISAWGQSLCAVKFVIKDFILKFLLVLIIEGRCDRYKLLRPVLKSHSANTSHNATTRAASCGIYSHNRT